MKTNLGSVFLSTRTGCGIFAPRRALPVVALMALLLAAPPSRGASVIQFAVTNCTVTEGCGQLEIPIQRTNNLDTVASVAVTTAALTATPGTNYTTLATNLTFLAREAIKTVSVPILNDGIVGPATKFNVLLSEPGGGAELGSKTNLMVTIWDNDTGLHFYVPALTNDIDAGQAVIKVARGDDGTNRVTVDYTTTNGTAKAGSDYIPAAGTLAFDPGEVLKSFTVPILNNPQPATNRTFSLALSHPSGGGVLGTGSVMTVTISTPRPAIQFDRAIYYAREEAEYVEIRVVRGAGGPAATVDFATSDGVAKAGLDYAGLTNTLQFAVGERLKLVHIPILNDGLKESTEAFRVTLSNPTGAAILGIPRFATVQIFDNDPGLGFTAGAYTMVSRVDLGVAKVAVTRGGDDRLASFTVDYQTTDGTAKAGVDYQATSGILEFQPNDTLKAIPIPILNNPSAKGQNSFTVTLSNPTGGIPLARAATQVKLFHPRFSGGYYPIVPLINARASLRQENGLNLLTWVGDGVLQRADQAAGPLENLAQVSSPYAIKPLLPMSFYQLQSTRSTEVYVPSSYNGKQPLPLILVLHPMGGGGGWMNSYFPLETLANSRGFFFYYPSGTVNATWGSFWNGPDFLNFCGDVDDSGYLRGVIEEIQRQYVVDPKRIYVTGASSGAAMSHRLAIEHADLIAGIAPISGRTYYDPQSVHPSQPVNVLQIEGTEDNYQGGYFDSFGLPVVAEVPGAVRTVQNWARLNGCTDPVVEAAPSLDTTPDVAGLDTTVLRYTQCPPGGVVELWTIKDGWHVPTLSSDSIARIVDWLLAHPKP